MTKTAAVAFEVRWRKNSDPANLWSSPVPVGADGHVSVPGLERVTDYTFEARAISACGAKSAWATQTLTLPDVPAGTPTLGGLDSALLIKNPNFVNGLNGWNYGTGWSATSTGSPNPNIPTCAQFSGGPANTGISNQALVPCQPGDQVALTAQIAASGANGSAYARIVWYNGSTQLGAPTNGNALTGTGTGTSRAVGTAPATANYFLAQGFIGAGYTTGTYALTGFTFALQPRTMDEVPDSSTRFAAAQAGADKTSLNTSADTSKVNGVAASSISPIGALMPAEAGAEKTTGKPLDILADGINYRRTGAGYIDTSGRPYRLWDGTTVREASFLSDGANRATSGLTSGGNLVSGKNSLDSIADSAMYIRTPITLGSGQTLAIPNADFSASLDAQGNIQGISPSAAAALQIGSGPGPWGSKNYMLVSNLSTTSGAQARVAGLEQTVCNPGDWIGGTIWMWPNNCQMQMAGYQFLDSAGNETGTVLAASNPGWGWYQYTFGGTAPAGTAFVRRLYVVQSTGAACSAGFATMRASMNDTRVPGSGAYGYVNFGDNTAGGHAGKHLGNMADDSISHRFAIASDDVYVSGGYNRLGLRVAGSNHQLADQRNVPSSLTTNLGIVRSATALTAQSTGAVNVNAHTIQLGNAAIPYNAVTNAVTGLTVGGSYYIYTNDNYAGGTQTWSATTSAQTANNVDGRYNAGQVTIPSSGSSGGGGGGSCVCADMYLRSGLTARQLAERWRWWKPWLWFLRGREGWHLIRRRPRVVQEYCARVTEADGSWLDCSISTPITTRGGESVQAPMAYGHLLWTDSGWQRTIECELLHGRRDVVRICVGGHSFLAGADPYRRIDTHNVWKP